MRSTKRLFAGAGLTLFAFSLQTHAQVSVVQYPPNAVPGGSYEVPPGEAKMYIENLVLPDRFKLSLNPSIKAIDWSVKNIRFGIDAEFDASAPQTKPATPGQPASPPQANACDVGTHGYKGTGGTAAAEPVKVYIHEIQKVFAQGSLWIVTNGAPAGNGGPGSQGGMGGGKGAGPVFRWTGGCDPKKGGVGGDGGDGERGGATSSVAFVKYREMVPYIANNCARAANDFVCGPVTANPGAGGNTGTITIFGGVGCGGAGGGKGYAGPGGDSGAGYGDDGNVVGTPGKNGFCSAATAAIPPPMAH